MPTPVRGRVRSIEEFGARMATLESVELIHYQPYEPQPGDVFISSWAKCGTTMMQQMFHQLRTGGDMDFDDISRMTPWEDSAVITDLDMTLPQRGSPRGFKSHREYERLPSGMRYVVTLRDPHETYVSFYRFINGWGIEPGAISLEDFFPLWMVGGPGGCDYFTHLLSWWARRDEPDTLLASYRWAAANRPAMIRLLANFCGIALTDELAALVEERTSREFMYANKDKFDDAMLSAAFDKRFGWPADSDSTKVQAIASEPTDVPPAVAEKIDAMWAERITPVTGHTDFASLAAELDRHADTWR